MRSSQNSTSVRTPAGSSAGKPTWATQVKSMNLVCSSNLRRPWVGISRQWCLAIKVHRLFPQICVYCRLIWSRSLTCSVDSAVPPGFIPVVEKGQFMCVMINQAASFHSEGFHAGYIVTLLWTRLAKKVLGASVQDSFKSSLARFLCSRAPSHARMLVSFTADMFVK